MKKTHMGGVRWTTAILTGLGLGAVAGCTEAAIVGMREGRSIGIFPLVSLAIWVSVGGVGALIGRIGAARAADPLAGRATIVLRTAIGLALFAAPVWVHINWSGGPRWQTLLAGGIVGLVALVAWLAAPVLVRRRVLLRPLAALRRLAPILLILAIAACTLLSTGRDHAGRMVRFRAASHTEQNPVRKSPSTKLFVIGLDSATWTLVQPLLERGELPHLRGLMGRGWWGVLRSTEPSFSPVVWTSIMTGKPAEVHGVQRTADQRRVKALWDIASEARLRSTVVNVPGTYPARADSAVTLVSGFPMPSQASSTSLGWIVTAGPASSYPTAPVHVQLPSSLTSVAPGDQVEAAVDLVDLPAGSRVVDSVPLVWLRGAGFDRLAYTLAQRFASRIFGRLVLAVERGEGGGGVRVTGRGEEQLFELTPGEWSDWLLLEWGDSRAWFRVHYTTANPEPTLFVTPLFCSPEASFIGPADELSFLMARPHVPEGAGWLLTFDERLLPSLRDHLMETADNLTGTALAALDRSAPDFFAYVFTLTDRVQHGFMRFAFPEPYRRLARERGGDYQRFQPTPQQVAAFGDAVSEAYRRGDAALGRILERAAPGSWVLVVSDHGARAGPRVDRPTAGDHDPKGLYVIARTPGDLENEADLAVGEQGPELDLEDITPIALHLLGLPVARDMTGHVPPFLLSATGPAKEIPTYESEDLASRPTVGDEAEMNEQLRSLGYLE